MRGPDPLPPADLRRVPPDLIDAVIRRGEWSFCAMEHSRIGAIEFEAPGASFHHIALPLERNPLRFGLHMDGRRQLGRNAPDMVTMIEAGAGGLTRWDDTYESACFYFTDAALATALGCGDERVEHDIRTRVELTEHNALGSGTSSNVQRNGRVPCLPVLQLGRNDQPCPTSCSDGLAIISAPPLGSRRDHWHGCRASDIPHRSCRHAMGLVQVRF
jgi:hypothetical protein